MSDYTGTVTVGGPAATRHLSALEITKIAVGSMDNNAYLLRCARTGDALLIDAANEPGRLLEMIPEGSLRTIVTTHQHGDHWQGLAELVRVTGAGTVAHPLDAGPLPVRPDRLVEGGDTIAVGAAELSVIHLRGHTPGSIALRYDDPDGTAHVFTGDSLFPGGPGRTTSPADFSTLIGDLESRIFGELPDDTWVYPGHGADTTLGAERPNLPEWRERGW
ncbi:MAG: MBL fold metallo-hydrolase [Actinomycetota bacterium]|nr:MBL fold metallo-hydrolase [Actinomycetota bacterium]